MLKKNRKGIRTRKVTACGLTLTTAIVICAVLLILFPSIFTLRVLRDVKPSSEEDAVWKTGAPRPQGGQELWIPVKPSWVVAQEQEDGCDVLKGNIRLLAESVKEVIDAESHAEVLDDKCHFVYPLNRQVVRLEYLLLGKLKNYMRCPSDFFATIRRQISQNLFIFTYPLPWVWRPMPIVLSSSFSITKEYGSWKAFFNHSPPFTKNLSTNASSESLWFLPRNASYNVGQLNEETPPLYVAMFPNAVASSGHVITCDGYVYTAGGCLSHWYLPAITQASQLNWFSVVVTICDEWCSGYFHFTHEHLLRLSLVHSILLDRRDAILVLSSTAKGFHREWLEDVLGIPSTRIRYETKPSHGQLVLYPTPNPCGRSFISLVHLMRGVVFERLQLVSTPPLYQNNKRKVFLLFAERKGGSRMPVNYDVLKKKLMSEYESVMSFTTILKKNSVIEQVRSFYNADIVFGPHGANLANALWMRRGTHLIEMLSYSYGNMCYYATATSIGVNYHALFHNSTKDGKYTLEYDYLKRHVEYALQMIK